MSIFSPNINGHKIYAKGSPTIPPIIQPNYTIIPLHIILIDLGLRTKYKRFLGQSVECIFQSIPDSGDNR